MGEDTESSSARNGEGRSALDLADWVESIAESMKRHLREIDLPDDEIEGYHERLLAALQALHGVDPHRYESQRQHMVLEAVDEAIEQRGRYPHGTSIIAALLLTLFDPGLTSRLIRDEKAYEKLQQLTNAWRRVGRPGKEEEPRATPWEAAYALFDTLAWKPSAPDTIESNWHRWKRGDIKVRRFRPLLFDKALKNKILDSLAVAVKRRRDKNSWA